MINETEFYKMIGKRLCSVLESKKMTQASLCKALNSPEDPERYNQPQISQWLTGKHRIPLSALVDICSCLNYSIDQLVDIDKKKEEFEEEINKEPNEKNHVKPKLKVYDLFSILFLAYDYIPMEISITESSVDDSVIAQNADADIDNMEMIHSIKNVLDAGTVNIKIHNIRFKILIEEWIDTLNIFDSKISWSTAKKMYELWKPDFLDTVKFQKDYSIPLDPSTRRYVKALFDDSNNLRSAMDFYHFRHNNVKLEEETFLMDNFSSTVNNFIFTNLGFDLPDSIFDQPPNCND